MAVGENNCGFSGTFLARLGARRATEGLGAPVGWAGICVGGCKRDEKSLNLTNSIPKSFRIIYIFTESFRKNENAILPRYSGGF